MRVLPMVAVLAACALLITGCAIPPEIPYDKTSATTIKTIVIVTPSVPTGSSVELASDAGQNFGLVGALVDASIASNHQAKLDGLLRARGFSAEQLVVTTLTADLQAQGYKIAVAPVPRNASSDFVGHYADVTQVKGDAYLDLVMTSYGYVAASASKDLPYRPEVVLKVRLVSALDGSVLMQDRVLYNPITFGGQPVTVDGVRTKKAVTVSVDPAYGFARFEDITKNPDLATKGLQVALQQSTNSVSQLLQ
jgi:hypothetical protein